MPAGAGISRVSRGPQQPARLKTKPLHAHKAAAASRAGCRYKARAEKQKERRPHGGNVYCLTGAPPSEQDAENTFSFFEAEEIMDPLRFPDASGGIIPENATDGDGVELAQASGMRLMRDGPAVKNIAMVSFIHSFIYKSASHSPEASCKPHEHSAKCASRSAIINRQAGRRTGGPADRYDGWLSVATFRERLTRVH